MNLKCGLFHCVKLPFDGWCFQAPVGMWGGVGGEGVVHWQVQREGPSGQTNLLIACTSVLHINVHSPVCRKNSVENRNTHYRKEGTIYHGGVRDGDPGGKAEGGESVQCQNWGEKLSISWQAPPKHLLPYLFGGTRWSKASSPQQSCQ